jgi:hypothetical protein
VCFIGVLRISSFRECGGVAWFVAGGGGEIRGRGERKREQEGKRNKEREGNREKTERGR